MATRTAEIAAVKTIIAEPGNLSSAKLNALFQLFSAFNDPTYQDKAIVLPASTPTSDGVADMTKSLFLLGSAVDLTAFTPAYAGQLAIIWCTASGTDPTVRCGSGVTINGAGNNKMTFPDADDAMIMVAATLTRWNIILNIGSVTLATV